MRPIDLIGHLAKACTGSQVTIPGTVCYATHLPVVNASPTELQTVLQIFFAILGAITVLFIIIGGFRYTISDGDPASMQKAKNTIIYAVVGLVVSLFAEAIVTFVLSYIK